MPDQIDSSSQAVQIHLGIVQSAIQRMAGNCTSCKAWCITIVSAILVLVADKNRPMFAYIALIPILLFLVLDAYYLAMERAFRNTYNQFVGKMHKGRLAAEDLYDVSPVGRIFLMTITSIWSFSVLSFYLMLFVMVLGMVHFILV
jgi:hypothetical protein